MHEGSIVRDLVTMKRQTDRHTQKLSHDQNVSKILLEIKFTIIKVVAVIAVVDGWLWHWPMRCICIQVSYQVFVCVLPDEGWINRKLAQEVVVHKFLLLSHEIYSAVIIYVWQLSSTLTVAAHCMLTDVSPFPFPTFITDQSEQSIGCNDAPHLELWFMG